MSVELIQGPATVLWKGVRFWLETGAEIDWAEEAADIPSDAFGTIKTVRAGISGTVKCTPQLFTANTAAALWPYGSILPGSLLCGAVDTPVVIHTLAGKLYTFKRGCISKMPSLKPTLKNPLIGEAEFTFFPAIGAKLEDENSVLALSDAAHTDTSFDPGKVLRGPWVYSLGGTEFAARDDMQIDFNLQTEVRSNTQRGPFDMFVKGLTVQVVYTPDELGHEGWLARQAFQGAGNGIGSTTQSRGKAFSVTTPGFAFTVSKMSPIKGQAFHSAAKPLEGQETLAAARTMTNGNTDALFSIGIGA